MEKHEKNGGKSREFIQKCSKDSKSWASVGLRGDARGDGVPRASCAAVAKRQERRWTKATSLKAPEFQ